MLHPGGRPTSFVFVLRSHIRQIEQRIFCYNPHVCYEGRDRGNPEWPEVYRSIFDFLSEFSSCPAGQRKRSADKVRTPDKPRFRKQEGRLGS
jgi:hypothetical protein